MNGRYTTVENAVAAIKMHTGFGNEKFINSEYERISWDEYFMSLAFLVAHRSPDSQTQHGAVIVDAANKIIATGYNGFLPGAEDICMPNLRPLKYQHIMHAEVNAILSAAQNLHNCKIYITGLPCNDCLAHDCQVWFEACCSW
jgi:dCMP deaminase